MLHRYIQNPVVYIFQLLHFLMHLRGEPIGLSVGGLVVMDKSLTLSVCSKHIFCSNKIYCFSLHLFISLVFFLSLSFSNFCVIFFFFYVRRLYKAYFICVNMYRCIISLYYLILLGYISDRRNYHIIPCSVVNSAKLKLKISLLNNELQTKTTRITTTTIIMTEGTIRTSFSIWV